jgi:hypothetical protein
MKLSLYSLPKMLYYTINFSETMCRKLKFCPHPEFPEEHNIRNSGNNNSVPQSEKLVNNHYMSINSNTTFCIYRRYHRHR